jgi:hypothetical protein
MTSKAVAVLIIALVLPAMYAIPVRDAVGAESVRPVPPDPESLWAHNNLFAWGVTVDSKSRTPEEQAQMLERLGLRQLGIGGQGQDMATFEQQIEAFERHGIKILAFSVTDVDDPTQAVDWKTYKNQEMAVLAGASRPAANAMTVVETLDLFKRHHMAPQLWLLRRMRASVPAPPPPSTKDFSEWTDAQKNQAFRNLLNYDPTVPQEREARVRREAARIGALAQLVAPYGVKVGLYKHGGWINIADNQIAIMRRLEELGVNNVGIVYQFIHAHDEVDDTANFPVVWRKMQPYVLAVNITGLHAGREAIYPILYPSQGELELQMMKTIQDSGWTGPIGVSPEKGGDAEVNLRNNVIGLDWLAAELRRPSSGGSRPFSAAH